ncbi:YrdB family protein [Kitasatospora sp. NPDC057223]|uniref:YrdB family protein n=1 Tax=Kitasatospora sp. NPDC057223 TaxID=3346055 RepID=UPI003641CAD9
MRIVRPGPVSGRSWTPVTVVNAGLAFALELGLLAALGYWGACTGAGPAVSVLSAIAAPALAATVWGLFLAAGGPRFPLPVAGEIALKLAVLGTGALALYAAGHPAPGVVFGGLALLSVAVEYTER